MWSKAAVAARSSSLPVGECVKMGENPWWHPTQDDLDWDEPLLGVIVLSPEYGAELPLWVGLGQH